MEVKNYSKRVLKITNFFVMAIIEAEIFHAFLGNEFFFFSFKGELDETIKSKEGNDRVKNMLNIFTMQQRSERTFN